MNAMTSALLTATLAFSSLTFSALSPRTVEARDVQGSVNASRMQVVPYVDVAKYMGVWYEIAHNPASFQNGCVGTTATYSLRTDGLVNVVNRCTIDTLDGEVNEIAGLAAVADPSTNAKLTVSFGGTPDPRGQGIRYFSGNYWVIGLDDQYQTAVVGEPTRTYLWFLSRTSSISQAQLDSLLSIAQGQGYDTSRLIYTEQAQ